MKAAGIRSTSRLARSSRSVRKASKINHLKAVEIDFSRRASIVLNQELGMNTE